MGEMIAFSTDGAGTIGCSHVKNRNLGSYLRPYTDINSKCLIGLNVRAKL